MHTRLSRGSVETLATLSTPPRSGLLVYLLIGIFLLFAAYSPLGAQTTNSAPLHPKAPEAATGFGTYLANHQEELTPFFSSHVDTLVKAGLPFTLKLVGNIILLNLVIGWAFDAGLGYGFSFLFAPAYAKLKQALIYATGRLILGVITGILAGLIATGVSFVLPVLLLGVVVVVILLNFVIQTFWVGMIYRTKPILSGLFYLSLIVVHMVVGALIAGPLLKARVNNMITQFMDQDVTMQLKSYTAESKQELTGISQARNKARDEANQAQQRLDTAKSEVARITADIEKKKNSENYMFSQIVHTRAIGNLTGARDQFTVFLGKFPGGVLENAAKTQLAEIQSDLALQDLQKKQSDVDAATAAARAQADLLVRAGKGEVALSEMRQLLVGKTRDQVITLFGRPAENDPVRWGYRQRWVINPVTNEKFGLTVYFSEGTVQSVDYYYAGSSPQVQ